MAKTRQILITHNSLTVGNNCHIENPDLRTSGYIYEEENADFSETRLKKVDFSDCRFKNAQFNNTILTNVDFSETEFINVDFSNATLSNVTFERASLISANFSGAKMHKVTFWDSDVSNANFQNIEFSECCFAFKKHNWLIYDSPNFYKELSYSRLGDPSKFKLIDSQFQWYRLLRLIFKNTSLDTSSIIGLCTLVFNKMKKISAVCNLDPRSIEVYKEYILSERLNLLKKVMDTPKIKDEKAGGVNRMKKTIKKNIPAEKKYDKLAAIAASRLEDKKNQEHL